MKEPSIDRINDGDYTFDNTRFIELKQNLTRGRGRETTCSECGKLERIRRGFCNKCYWLIIAKPRKGMVVEK